MLAVILIVLLLWALGLFAHVGGIINILLIIALVLFILNMSGSRRL